MTLPFTAAAIDRIVQCVTQLPDRHQTGAIETLSKMIENSSMPSGEWETSIDLIGWAFPIGEREYIGDYAGRLVLTIAGLIELGLLAGYIDLVEWGSDRTSQLKDLLIAFEKKPLFRDNETPCDLTLFQALLNRLERNDLRGASPDGAFAVFESYLSLTALVWSDDSFQRFLLSTHEGGWREPDLQFLISPRHFAAALVTGDMRWNVIHGGLAALRYYHWLAELLDRLSGVPAIQEGIVRNAEWCHNVQNVFARFEHWANRMAEWNEMASDDSEMAAWRLYWSSVFGPLLEHLKALQKPVDIHKVFEDQRNFEQGRSPEQLIAEGRIGAALREVRFSARHDYENLMRDKTAADWTPRAHKLITNCETLVKLGDVDSAAAYLEALLKEFYGRDLTDIIVRAASIVRLARQGAQLVDEEQSPSRKASTTIATEQSRTAPSVKRSRTRDAS